MIKKRYTRHFLGNLSPDRKDRAYEQKHLRAYIKGWDLFPFGSQVVNGQRQPIMHKVQQKITEL